MPPLSDLPEDVLLQIVKYLLLSDAVSFSQVCRIFKALAEEHTFWSSTLLYSLDTHPLICPSYTDLSTLSVSSLKLLAKKTLKRESNWSLPQPLTIGPVRSITCGPRCDILFPVPGTHLVVMHYRGVVDLQNNGMAVLWDLEAAKVCNAVFAGPRIADISGGYEERGKFSMALLASTSWSGHPSGQQTIVVLTVEHGPGRESKMTETFRLPLQGGSEIYYSLFLYDDVVGVLCENSDTRSPVSLVAYNMRSNEQVVVKTSIYAGIGRPEQVGSSVLDGDIYLLQDSVEGTFIHRCPRSLLPYRNSLSHLSLATRPTNADTILDPECVTEGPFFWAQDIDTHDYQSSSIVCCGTPSYVANLVTMYHRTPRLPIDEPNEDSPDTTVRFWPAFPIPGFSPEENDGLSNPSTSTTRRIAYSPDDAIMIPFSLGDHSLGSWRLVMFSHSGRNLLFVGQRQDMLTLLLIRYRDELGDGRKVSAHNLQVPSHVDLKEVSGITLDDFLGVVYLLTPQGCLHALSYA